MKSKIKDYSILILAVIGILISVELSIIYYNANFLSAIKPSFCAINETINCDSVARTQYSHFLGVPMSIYGLIYYIVVFIFSIFILGYQEKFKNIKSYLFSLSTIGLLISLVLGGISALLIHKICILCYITYFINLFIFILSKSGISFMSHYENTLKDVFSTLSKPFYLLISVILLIITVSTLYYINTSKIFVSNSSNINNDSIVYTSENPNKSVVYGNILGSKKPKLIIQEYTDFQCPYCSISNIMMHRLVQEVDGVQVIHNDYPLNSQCNPGVKEKIHKNSCNAALYARAARKQNKFWEFSSLLFENQQDLSENKILGLAKKAGLDTNKLKRDAHSVEESQALRSDTMRANKMGITGTPTYFIGMKKYEGLLPYPEFKKIVLESKR